MLHGNILQYLESVVWREADVTHLVSKAVVLSAQTSRL